MDRETVRCLLYRSAWSDHHGGLTCRACVSDGPGDRLGLDGYHYNGTDLSTGQAARFRGEHASPASLDRITALTPRPWCRGNTGHDHRRHHRALTECAQQQNEGGEYRETDVPAADGHAAETRRLAPRPFCPASATAQAPRNYSGCPGQQVAAVRAPEASCRRGLGAAQCHFPLHSQLFPGCCRYTDTADGDIVAVQLPGHGRATVKPSVKAAGAASPGRPDGNKSSSSGCVEQCE